MTFEQLEARLAATPESEWEKRQNLLARRTMARGASDALAEVEPELAELTKWRDHLIEWRQILCDRLPAASSGSMHGLKLSIIRIDRELDFVNEGYPANLPLDDLMREAGYVPRDAVSRAHGDAWLGSMPKVERRLAELQKRRDQAEKDINYALQETVIA